MVSIANYKYINTSDPHCDIKVYLQWHHGLIYHNNYDCLNFIVQFSEEPCGIYTH